MVLQVYFGILVILGFSALVAAMCQEFARIDYRPKKTYKPIEEKAYKITRRVSITCFIVYILYSVFALIYGIFTAKWYFLLNAMMLLIVIISGFVACKNGKNRRKYYGIINFGGWFALIWLANNVNMLIICVKVIS